jgi:hypothetical protein
MRGRGGEREVVGDTRLFGMHLKRVTLAQLAKQLMHQQKQKAPRRYEVHRVKNQATIELE